MSFPGPLSIQGPMFLDSRNVRWLWKGCSDFRLFQRYLDGEDITAVLNERVSLGANVLRVFCMYDGGIGRFRPADYAQYDQQMQEFINLLGIRGLRIEWNILADCQRIMPERGTQRVFVRQITERCRGWTNCFCSLGNEYPQNGFHPDDFTKPLGAGAPFWSFGSGLSDASPAKVAESDYLEWHGRRDHPKVFTSAEDMWYVGHGITVDGRTYAATRPIVHDEPIGFAEYEEPGRRSTNPDLARTLALSGLAYGSGATFHSTDGLNSRLCGPTTRRCAEAFFGEFRDR